MLYRDDKTSKLPYPTLRHTLLQVSRFSVVSLEQTLDVDRLFYSGTKPNLFIPAQSSSDTAPTRNLSSENPHTQNETQNGEVLSIKIVTLSYSPRLKVQALNHQKPKFYLELLCPRTKMHHIQASGSQLHCGIQQRLIFVLNKVKVNFTCLCCEHRPTQKPIGLKLI